MHSVLIIVNTSRNWKCKISIALQCTTKKFHDKKHIFGKKENILDSENPEKIVHIRHDHQKLYINEHIFKQFINFILIYEWIWLGRWKSMGSGCWSEPNPFSQTSAPTSPRCFIIKLSFQYCILYFIE